MEYRIEHVTSSPHYPKSNSTVKKMAKVAKDIFKKAEDLNLGLLILVQDNSATLCVYSCPASHGKTAAHDAAYLAISAELQDEEPCRIPQKG